MHGPNENQRVISHCRIVSKIGAGGLGEVYLAEDTRLHRKGGLKILRVEVDPNRERMCPFILLCT
jgi:serine/threonine protein kinase